MEFSDFNLEKTGDGLLPVIIQDANTLKVLSGLEISVLTLGFTKS